MVKLLSGKIAIFIILIINLNEVFAQCNINQCTRIATISADAPFFNANNKSIVINNIAFANPTCVIPNFIIGIDIYVYQLLPDNSQVRNCNVLQPIPDNLLGVVQLDMGNSTLCNQSFNIGSINLNANNGFDICDGARYQIEMALYATTNLNFKNLNKTVDAVLSSSEYKLINLGIVEANITNTFTNGQPLMIANVLNWDTRSNSTVVVPCNQDVEIYVQGQSIIADCAPFGDFSNAIPSEMVNTFTYSVNGGSEVVIENSSTGARGGQLTGAISSANSACYGGILTNIVPYTFDVSSTIGNACGGTEVTFTIVTRDVFTSLTKSASHSIIFDNCVPALSLNQNNISSPVYAAAQTVQSTGSVANNANVVFQAGSQVSLNNNFSIPKSANFAAEIYACQ